jgi:hypothetical protein
MRFSTNYKIFGQPYGTEDDFNAGFDAGQVLWRLDVLLKLGMESIGDDTFEGGNDEIEATFSLDKDADGNESATLTLKGGNPKALAEAIRQLRESLENGGVIGATD